MSGFAFLEFAAGLVLLMIGASLLVRGAVALAARLGTPPLVIGLTVVAFGTSSPEVLVSLQAAWVGDPEIALGNVIGSNIFNVLFILGISALVAPLVVSERLVRRDVPVMIAVSLLVYAFGWDGQLSSVEGIVLLATIVLYTSYLIRGARRGTVSTELPEATVTKHWSIDTALILGGLGLQVVGSWWLVESSIRIATALGVSELVIGLTIVAAGTSLPEVATSIAASARGQRDMAVGNVVGSNIFNLLLVLGCAAVVSPVPFEVARAALAFDLPVMIAVAVACLPIFVRGYSLDRWEGGIFLIYYVAYTVFLVLDATDHSAAPVFGGLVLGFVMPITVLTLVVITFRARGRRQESSPPPD